MKLLALETSGRDVAVAVADETGVLAGASVRSGRRHAELLHPLVQHTLELAGVAFGQLDAVAVDVGPGLFTGIRVGVAAAKGFASALAIPVVALTSLDILRAACEPSSSRLVVPVVDLRRGDVAWSLPGESIAFGSPESLALLLGAIETPVVIAGDGALRYASRLGADGSPGGVVVAGVELAAPPVASLAVRAVAEVEAGRTIDPVAVLPAYLRDADTRINWTTRHDAPARLERAAEAR